ncbi:MAG: sugar ABC transporter permease [Oscillospiraceae bacterium]|nr:sugar ABC transporter permease [Oscillospiraceae bacterium]
MEKAKSFLSKNAMFIGLIVVMLLFEMLIRSSGRGTMLLSPFHLTNLISQNGYVVILATGMLLCILTGGNIDLSVGSVVILVSAIAGVLIVDMGVNVYVTILICLLTGTAIGAWQAFLIAYLRVPPFVTTLAGMLIFRGIALLILGAQSISPFPDNYRVLFNSFIPGAGSDPAFIQNLSLTLAVVVCVGFIGLQIFSRISKERKGYTVESIYSMLARIIIISGVVMFVFTRLGENRGIPILLVWLAAIVMIYSYFTQNTIPGRYLYAMGGNEKAARLSGINTKRMKFFAYTNMGFLSAVAALVCVARFNAATTTVGVGFELDAIGACFIGGASAYGGIGRVGGAVIGAIFMGVLDMGMSIMGLDVNLQRVIKGSVLLAAVIFDVMSKSRKQAA